MWTIRNQLIPCSPFRWHRFVTLRRKWAKCYLISRPHPPNILFHNGPRWDILHCEKRSNHEITFLQSGLTKIRKSHLTANIEKILKHPPLLQGSKFNLPNKAYETFVHYEKGRGFSLFYSAILKKFTETLSQYCKVTLMGVPPP